MEIRKTDPWPYFLRTWFYINFFKHFFPVLKISKTFVFYLRTSGEYLTSYGQGSILTDPWKLILKKRILIQISLNIHLVLEQKTKGFQIWNVYAWLLNFMFGFRYNYLNYEKVEKRNIYKHNKKFHIPGHHDCSKGKRNTFFINITWIACKEHWL